MLSFAWRNFTFTFVRSCLAIATVSLTLLLVLALDGVVTGMERQFARYIERSGADVWVAQRGVRNLHMMASTLPASLTPRVRATPGVLDVTPILYATQTVVLRNDVSFQYVIGLPDGATSGGPWRVIQGRTRLRAREVLLDAAQAARANVKLGGVVRLAGRAFVVAGFTNGTVSPLNGVVFVRFEDLAGIRRARNTISFLLVRVRAGTSSAHVARALTRTFPVTALTTRDFAASERRVIRDMGADVINLMSGVGYAVGLVVLALTVHSATFARRAEYLTLRALGASVPFLAGVVLAEALLTVTFGFTLAVTVSGALAVGLPHVTEGVTLQLAARDVARVAASAWLLAGLAALSSVTFVARLDPARAHGGV